MYSRKTRGYIPCNPPPNYNGVAFTRDFKAQTEIPEKELPVSEPQCECMEQCTEDGTLCEEDEIIAEGETECTQPPSCAEEECPGQEQTECAENQEISRELTVEDLMIIGAVLLFVSGEFDGDIMLLLGLLLIAGV